MDKRSKKLAKNTAILGIGALASKAIMFLLAPLLTRWISKDIYGDYDLIITYASLLIPLVTVSVGEGAFRFLIEKDEYVEKKKIISSALCIVVIGFTVGVSVLFVASIFISTLARIIWIFIPLLLTQALYEFNLMIARGFKNTKQYTITNIIFAAILLFSCFVVVKIWNGGLVGALSSYIIGYLVGGLYLFLNLKIYKYLNKKYISRVTAKSLVKYSLPLAPNAIAWWVINASDRTIVTMILGAASNAIVAVANKIPNICQALFGVFHLSWQENASESVNDKDRTEYYNKVMNSIFQIICSVCIVVLAINFLIFKFLFTEEYNEAAKLSVIMIVTIIFSIMGQFYGGIHIAEKRPIANGLTTMIAAAINVIVNLALIFKIGIYAAPISTAVSYVSLFVIRHVDITRKRKIELKYSGLSILIMFAVVYFAIVAFLDVGILNVLNVFLAIIIFVFVNKNKFMGIMVNKLQKKKGEKKK